MEDIEDSSSSEEFDGTFDEELEEIRDEIHIYLSSLGYITQISQSSFCPEKLTVSVHGNTLIHPFSFAEFLMVIVKTKPDSGLTYTFYCQFFVDSKKTMYMNDSQPSYTKHSKYMFGALTVDRLMNHIKKCINNLQNEAYKNKYVVY